MNNTEPIGNSEQLSSDIIWTAKPMIELDKALKFAEWCSENMYNHVVNRHWESAVFPNKFKSTEELFKLFDEEDKLNQK